MASPTPTPTPTPAPTTTPNRAVPPSHIIEAYAYAGFFQRREAKKLAKRLILESSFHEFVRAAWPHIETTPLIDGWYIGAVCEHLQAVSEGHIRNLLLTVAPRCAKSLLVATLWPCWEWTRWPENRWMFASYAATLSKRDSIKRRDLIKSAWYRNFWWGWKLKDDSDTQVRFENTKHGWMFSTSIGGVVTGEGGDRQVIDDPLKADARFSKAERVEAIRFYDSTWVTRINDPKTIRRVVIGQCICQDDFIGHIRSLGTYEELCLPMHWTKTHHYAKGPFPLPGTYDPRSRGETDSDLLCPKRFSEEEVNAYAPPGAYDRSAQIEQDPQPEEGDMFSRKNFCYFTAEGVGENETFTLQCRDGKTRKVRAADCCWFQTIDTALEDTDTAAYTVVTTLAITPAPACLLVYDVARERLVVPRQYGFILAQRKRHPRVMAQYVEKKASGHGLLQEGAISGTPFGALVADVSKEKRAVAIAIAYENGMVFHRVGAPWLDILEDELLSFPSGTYKDQVDTLSYAGLIMQRQTYMSLLGSQHIAYLPEGEGAVKSDNENKDRDDDRDGDGGKNGSAVDGSEPKRTMADDLAAALGMGGAGGQAAGGGQAGGTALSRARSVRPEWFQRD